MDDLKNCPFCGSEASDEGVTRYKGKPTAWWKDGTPVDIAFFCNCPTCGVSNQGGVGGFPTRREAIAAWNTRTAYRAPAPETAGLVDLLGSAAAYLNADHAIGHAADVLRAANALTAMQARLDDVTAERDATRKKLWGEHDFRRQLANMHAVAEDRTAERDALQQQLAQAREALNRIARGSYDGLEVAHLSARQCRDVARAALTPSPTRSTEDVA